MWILHGSIQLIDFDLIRVSIWRRIQFISPLSLPLLMVDITLETYKTARKIFGENSELRHIVETFSSSFYVIFNLFPPEHLLLKHTCPAFGLEERLWVLSTFIFQIIQRKNGRARYDIGWHNRETTYLVWSCRENGPNTTNKNYYSLEIWRQEKNEAVPGEPGKMEYIQPWMKEI